jgi:hypothetical protein
VLNAQNANFSAVIIYNYEDLIITMNPHGRGNRNDDSFIFNRLFLFLFIS